MKVFKFGGASIETVERALHVAQIIEQHQDEKLLVIVSAKGKTTNALEEIVRAYFNGDISLATTLFQALEKNHNDYAQELLGDEASAAIQKLKEFYTEIEWILAETPVRSFNYYYDQVVSMGELLSTTLIAAYLQKIGLSIQWLDVRDILKTDHNYRDANIHWEETEQHAHRHIGEAFLQHEIIITQGYIGCTDENHTVTLGREGSDYTAAVFANMLNANSVTIWKDVPSLLNADPKQFPNTIAIPEITFHEVIEMAFYGAQVIHPKTIKPLFSKDIPLYVKCFLDPTLPGTIIHNTTKAIAYPPILVLKRKQILLQVTTKDYSFITENNLSNIYNLFASCKIKINLIQNAAISFVACIDSDLELLEELLTVLQKEYVVKRNEDLFLFTVRHYTEDILQEELKNRTVLLEQKTRQTIQMVVR